MDGHDERKGRGALLLVYAEISAQRRVVLGGVGRPGSHVQRSRDREVGSPARLQPAFTALQITENRASRGWKALARCHGRERADRRRKLVGDGAARRRGPWAAAVRRVPEVASRRPGVGHQAPPGVAGRSQSQGLRRPRGGPWPDAGNHRFVGRPGAGYSRALGWPGVRRRGW